MLLSRAPLVTRGLCRFSLESGAEVGYLFTDGAPRSARVVLNPAVTRADIVTPFRPGKAGWAVGAGRQGSERTGMCGALGFPPRAALFSSDPPPGAGSGCVRWAARLSSLAVAAFPVVSTVV